MRITETIPGSFVVCYSYSVKSGGRRKTFESSIAVAVTEACDAEAAAFARRGHLDAYTVLSVGPETSTRPATRAEELDAANKALAALQAKRGAK